MSNATSTEITKLKQKHLFATKITLTEMSQSCGHINSITRCTGITV